MENMDLIDKYLIEELPKGGRQHTDSALKDFAKRQEQRKKQYLGVHNDPNSAFNKHVDALNKHKPEWTEIDGIGVYRVKGSKIAALPANDKKSSAKWVIFDIKKRKELTQVTKKELFQYLSRYAVDTEGMK